MQPLYTNLTTLTLDLLTPSPGRQSNAEILISDAPDPFSLARLHPLFSDANSCGVDTAYVTAVYLAQFHVAGNGERRLHAVICEGFRADVAQTGCTDVRRICKSVQSVCGGLKKYSQRKVVLNMFPM